jgi:hypothetical protein
MGALMVVDPQHTTRYQPVWLYINRGAPKNQRLVGETGKKPMRQRRKTEKTGGETRKKKPKAKQRG